MSDLLRPIRDNRWRLLCAAALGMLLFSGCATRNENDVSTIPWNRPQSWEGGGALGGFSTDALNQ